MSVTSFWASRDLQRQMAQSTRSGRLAGKRFVDHNDHRDKLWFGGVLNEIEEKVDTLELPQEVDRFFKNNSKAVTENPVVEGLHAISDPSSAITDYLKGNLPLICIRGSLSCAAFHEFKERGVKRLARRYGPSANFKYGDRIQPATEYACDHLLPTSLYGPFFILLTRKLGEYVVGTALKKVGLKKED
mmetsp:Transcript_2982/g.8737  ORF Transcript_2982/g.8737 Transcript_2982/m.8737 type:complete len:188 (+) Transcript_2982:304-867(+)|eukprot:CAMPEP_0206142450 /NCGR_PEP_ID=MMETSP1473-20131121/16867_1 /ASSEMBLY_ACC=CAM_ASM_001109 /TAXON_ID=1461547 /ORGANISM="Stichococcus sp, Strain RCC1054" /LENGTH=187 /DNA_ID=CAMNT_0053537451 /DNA_START=236 /DNA_END=799 /DNA_ORIENTATION=-